MLNGLCALISAARRRAGDGEGARLQPFLRVGLHLWVRELRRMVCSVRPLETPGGARYALRHSDDLAAEDGALHLPLVQCRECRRTGWGAVRRAGDRKLDANLQVFYNRFFARDVDVVFLFPDEPPAGARGEPKTLCDCRWLGAGHGTEDCDDCGRPDRLARVFLPEATETFRPRDGKPVRRLSRDCPFCGAREALLIFGARASNLLSVALGQVFASRHNDDRKVIAFSDNVQDAAHRAGFIAARTWPNIPRAAIAQVVAERDGISLAELAGTAGGDGAVVARWRDLEANPGALDPERFVAEFLAPDRHWLRDFARLQRDGRLPPDSDLPDLVADRLRWETLAELGHKSTIGRTLERTRAAAVGVDRERFERAAASAHRRLCEEFGSLRGITTETVRALLLGILRRLRERGAIRSDGNDRFLGKGASIRWLSGQLPLPEFGRGSPRPVFPTDGASGDGLEPLAGGGTRRSWYRVWTERMLALPPLSLAMQDAPAVLLGALAALEDTGLVRRVPVGPSHAGTHAWALDPERFFVTPRACVLRGGASRPLVVPEDEADLWLGLPCLDPGSRDAYDRCEPAAPTWFGKLYRRSALRRIVAAEHTALLTREQREELQRRFAAADPAPWDPNLLSATPTLELGIDIGDLSTVALASAPPGAGELRPAHWTRRPPGRQRLHAGDRRRPAARPLLLRGTARHAGGPNRAAGGVPERLGGARTPAHRVRVRLLVGERGGRTGRAAASPRRPGCRREGRVGPVPLPLLRFRAAPRHLDSGSVRRGVRPRPGARLARNPGPLPARGRGGRRFARAADRGPVGGGGRRTEGAQGRDRAVGAADPKARRRAAGRGQRRGGQGTAAGTERAAIGAAANERPADVQLPDRRGAAAQLRLPGEGGDAEVRDLPGPGAAPGRGSDGPRLRARHLRVRAARRLGAQ